VPADTKLDNLKKKLLMQPKNGWEGLDPGKKDCVFAFCEDYKVFLDNSKTERDCADYVESLAKDNGFTVYSRGMKLKPGDRVFLVNRSRSVVLAVIGKKPLSEGLNIIAAHIDAPRLDLKPRPLYEDDELGYFKTHYYGGIKKYQWTAMPLELKGIVNLRSGKSVRVSIGGNPGDPVFTITDLLPHLSKDQYEKKLSEAIPGENLNILIGSIPLEGEGDGRLKLALVKLLNERYGIIERDLISAELSIVPAFSARDVGLDCSMVGGYGQDDRVCAYVALRAILETELPEKTAVCFLADKEEIGSEGVSGMRSRFFETFVGDLCECEGTRLDICFSASSCISADVLNAHDPNYADVSDKRNTARFNYGPALLKYTGSRGKSGASDATSEYMEKICDLFDKAQIPWQTGTLGKVDQGGGGTVAVYMAQRNIDTLDAGVPVLSMHSPFEVTSKLDIYFSCEGFKAFYAM